MNGYFNEDNCPFLFEVHAKFIGHLIDPSEYTREVHHDYR